jgi:subtilisin family serine protease
MRLTRAYHLRLPQGLSVGQALRRLRADPRVESASPNFYRYIDRYPDDPDLDKQWGLDNVGQTGGTADADIDAPEAWDLVTGSDDVVVAVIDSGAQLDHEDLRDNVWINPGEDLDGNGRADPGDENGIDDDGNGFVDDLVGWDFVGEDNDPSPAGAACGGHGTHTAGTIAAVGDNGVGATGVAWNVRVMVVKAFRVQFGLLCSATDADLIQAIEYATLQGARVTSNSWGGTGFNSIMRDAIRDSNAVFVAAAGNGGYDGRGDNNDRRPHYPSSYPLDNIVAVAATDHDDARASFSNFGNRSVDLGAPGVTIWSTLPGDAYGFYSGTSMATPHVSGVAALLLAQDPDYTVAEVTSRLLGGVDPVAGLGRTTTGGRLNAFGSLTLPQASETGVTGTLEVGSTTVTRGGTLDLTITLQNNTASPIAGEKLLYVKPPGLDEVVLAGPITTELDAHEVQTIPYPVQVPAGAPPGVYRLFGRVSNPDGLEEDMIEITVLP